MVERLRLGNGVESKLPTIVSLDKEGFLLEYRGVQVENVTSVKEGVVVKELVFSHKKQKGGYETVRISHEDLKEKGFYKIDRGSKSLPVVFALDDDGDLVCGTEEMMEKYNPDRAVYSRGLNEYERWDFAASRATRAALFVFGGYALLRILGLPSCMEFSGVDRNHLGGLNPLFIDAGAAMLLVFGSYVAFSSYYYNSNWMNNLRFSTTERPLEDHSFAGFVASGCSMAVRSGIFACTIALENLMDTVGTSKVGGPHIPTSAVEALEENQASDPVVYDESDSGSWGVPGGGTLFSHDVSTQGAFLRIARLQMHVPASRVQRRGELLAEGDEDGFKFGERYVGPFTVAEEEVALEIETEDFVEIDLDVDLGLPEEEVVGEEVEEEVTENA